MNNCKNINVYEQYMIALEECRCEYCEGCGYLSLYRRKCHFCYARGLTLSTTRMIKILEDITIEHL